MGTRPPHSRKYHAQPLTPFSTSLGTEMDAGHKRLGTRYCPWGLKAQWPHPMKAPGETAPGKPQASSSALLHVADMGPSCVDQPGGRGVLATTQRGDPPRGRPPPRGTILGISTCVALKPQRRSITCHVPAVAMPRMRQLSQALNEGPPPTNNT